MIGRGDVSRQENIGRFEVSMDDTRLMGIIDGHADRCNEPQDICAWWNFPHVRRAAYILCQLLPFHVIHNQVGHSSARRLWGQETEVMHLHDVGMMQRSNNLSFVDETRGKIRVSLRVCPEELHGDRALELGVIGLPDLSHAIMR